MSDTATADRKEATPTSWEQEGRDLARAVSGGLLFGVPLLYTMEVWWLGAHTSPGQMLITLALLFAALLGLNATVGFRDTRDLSIIEAAEDTLEAIAIGIVTTTLVLVVLRQITLETSLPSGLGSVVNECIPFCLGIGVARYLLQGDPGLSEDDTAEDDTAEDDTAEDDTTENGASEDEATLRGSLADVGATALGATFVGLAIAPTDEVSMLAAAMGPAWQVVVLVGTLAMSYMVVFIAGFAGQDRRHQHQGIFDRPLTETFVTYLVALAVSAVLLWVFQRGISPPSDFFARVVVLGLPASVGGAVGRLAL